MRSDLPSDRMDGIASKTPFNFSSSADGSASLSSISVDGRRLNSSCAVLASGSRSGSVFVCRFPLRLNDGNRTGGGIDLFQPDFQPFRKAVTFSVLVLVALGSAPA